MRIFSILLLLCCLATPGHALDFDGTDDFASIATNPFNAVSATTFTIEFWAKISSAAFDGVAKTLIGGFDGTAGVALAADDQGVSFGLTPTNALTVDIGTAGGEMYVGADNAFDTSGAWYHYAVTYDATTVVIYRNGSALTTENSLFTNTGNLVPGALTTYIMGNPAPDAAYCLAGQIEDIRFYNTVLSAAVIADHAGSRLRYVRGPHPIGYWPMDGCADGASGDGVTFVDRSGNGFSIVGDNGANNTGLTCRAHGNLAYPGGIQ